MCLTTCILSAELLSYHFFCFALSRSAYINILLPPVSHHIEIVPTFTLLLLYSYLTVILVFLWSPPPVSLLRFTLPIFILSSPSPCTHSPSSFNFPLSKSRLIYSPPPLPSSYLYPFTRVTFLHHFLFPQLRVFIPPFSFSLSPNSVFTSY